MASRKKTGLTAAGLLAVSLILWFYLSPDDPIEGKGSAVARYPDKKQVTCAFTIKNKTARVIPRAKLWVPAPVRQTSFQESMDIVTSMPFHRIDTVHGNQVLEFDITDLPPYAVRTVRITAFLNVAAVPVPMENDGGSDFLSPGPFIESDHPDIMAAAQALKGRDDPETAKNIFSFVSAHIQDAGYIEPVRGALYALLHRKGDCTEYAALFTALCRASRIPARCIGGYVCNQNCLLVASGYHNWAEVFINGEWRVVDCQKGVFMQDESGYVAFQVVSGRDMWPIPAFQRLMYETDGIQVTMNR